MVLIATIVVGVKSAVPAAALLLLSTYATTGGVGVGLLPGPLSGMVVLNAGTRSRVLRLGSE